MVESHCQDDQGGFPCGGVSGLGDNLHRDRPQRQVKSDNRLDLRDSHEYLKRHRTWCGMSGVLKGSQARVLIW